jgi:hypothetical protein
MKIPNWLKISWWILLLTISTIVLLIRFNAIKSGNSVPFDVFLFLIWIALMLVPIFSEMEFFGIKLKQEIEDMKIQFSLKIGELRNDIKINQSQKFVAYISPYGPPPPDDKIDELRELIDNLTRDDGLNSPKLIKSRIDLGVPQENVDLFKIRYNIEKEINRIWIGRFDRDIPDDFQRKSPLVKQIQELLQFKIINSEIDGLLREILAICNYGIHGATISKKQMSFMNGSSEKLISYLRKIK